MTNETDALSPPQLEAPGPLEHPTGPNGMRPATAWVIGLFAAVALASILRHVLS